MNWPFTFSRKYPYLQWQDPAWLAFRRNRIKRDYVSPTIMAAIWLDAAAGLFLTSQGKLLLAAVFPIAMFALLLTRSPAFLLFLLLILLLLTDWICKWFFPRRLEIRRRLPVRVGCGIPFEVRTIVRNRSGLPAYDFLVNENLFPALVPVEKNRAVYCLAPHSELEIRQSFLIRRRGIYELPPPAAEGVFPFRLFKAVRRGRDRQELICHPVYTEFQNLRLPGSLIRGDEMSAAAHRAGESLDFLGCREYQAGDDPRKIHWMASAKRGRLAVKEFQEEEMASAAVILDNYCPEPTRQWKELLHRIIRLKPLRRSMEQSFEAAVSLAASIAHSLAVRNFVIDVFASGSEIHHFRTGRNTMSFEAFLDLLASLEGSRSEDRFDKFPVSDLDRAASSGLVFLILQRADPQSEKLYRELLRRGAEVRVLLFADDTLAPVPDWAERLTSTEILESRRTFL